MRSLVTLSLIFGFASVVSGLAHAGMNKCVNADGKVSYSDQPCSAKVGEKVAEPKDSGAFSIAQAREGEQAVMSSCHVLTERTNQCRGSLFSPLQSALRDNCAGPLGRYRAESEKQRNERYRNQRNAHSYNRSQTSNVEDPMEKKEAARCETLEADAWKFVKDNFKRRVPEDVVHKIEMHLNGVPEGGPTISVPNRRRNQY